MTMSFVPGYLHFAARRGKIKGLVGGGRGGKVGRGRGAEVVGGSAEGGDYVKKLREIGRGYETR